MGAGQSKGGMKRNTSAAFGRLRIDSPRATPGSGRMTMRQRKTLRMDDHPITTATTTTTTTAATNGLTSSGSMQGFPAVPSETSPLLSSHETPRILEGKMESMESTEMIGSPPLAVWIVPALCCAFAYALYNIFIKKGSYHINPVLGGVILQLVAALLGTFLLLFLIWREGAEEVVIYNMEGIQWAILAGISVGTAEIVSFFVSSLGVQAMQSIPIIIGGSVMFGTVLGAVALHEALTYRGWIGVLMISVGISLVGIDDSGEGHP